MKRREFLKASTMGVAATTGLLVIGNQVNGIEQPAASGRLESPDPEVLAKAVYRNFIPGKRTCGEAMLLGCCEALGIESDVIPNIALGMGGGIGLQGQVCGIVTSGTMVIGLVVGSRETEYSKRKMRVFAASGQFLQRFEKEQGTLSCAKITGLDLTTPQGRKQLKERDKAGKCAPVIQAGARMLAQVLRQDEEHPSYEPPPRMQHSQTED